MKTETIKVEIPKELAEKFRKYIAKKYGYRKGILSKVISLLIEEKILEDEYKKQFNTKEVEELLSKILKEKISDEEIIGIISGEEVMEAKDSFKNVD